MSIQAHIARTDNPHQVTKEQLGLGNVQNYPVATREEVIALTATDRYIDFNNMSWVSEAFVNYMFELGIIDENGNYNQAPTDLSGTLFFYQNEAGNVVLEGTHPSATSVDVIVTTNATTVSETLSLALTNGAWTVDTSALTIDPANTYLVTVSYYDNTGVKTGRRTGYLDLLNLSASFLINSVSNGVTISGTATDYDQVDVVINDGINDIFTFVNQPIAADGTWALDLSTEEFDQNTPYTATVKGYLDGTLINTVVENSQIDVMPAGSYVYTDPSTGVTYVDFRRTSDLSDVGLYYIDGGVQV